MWDRSGRRHSGPGVRGEGEQGGSPTREGGRVGQVVFYPHEFHPTQSPQKQHKCQHRHLPNDLYPPPDGQLGPQLHPVS